jgi:hypothetical protein
LNKKCWKIIVATSQDLDFHVKILDGSKVINDILSSVTVIYPSTREMDN